MGNTSQKENRQLNFNFSANPSKPIGKFNLIAIKDLVNSTQFSCLCAKNEDKKFSDPNPRIHHNNTTLTSLSRGYLARKLRDQLYNEQSNSLSKKNSNSGSEINKLNYLSTENTFNQEFKMRCQVVRLEVLGSLEDESENEDLKKSQLEMLIESNLDDSVNSERTDRSKRVYENPLKKYTEMVYNKKVLESSEESSEESQEIIESSISQGECLEVKLVTGSVYLGEMNDGKPHGVGKEKWPDKSTYEGSYNNGMRTGQGVFTWPDKSFYKGCFVNNEMQGYGVFKWRNGNRYEGMWKNSKMHGEGKFLWKDGNKYIGEYEDGLKHGAGIFIWSNGKMIKGIWCQGKLNTNV